MLASLQDPDSRFLEAPEVAELNSRSQRRIYRASARLLPCAACPMPKTGDIPAYTEYRLVVVAPLPGSPAEKAGLQAGDMVATINGQWVYNDTVCLLPDQNPESRSGRPGAVQQDAGGAAKKD